MSVQPGGGGRRTAAQGVLAGVLLVVALLVQVAACGPLLGDGTFTAVSVQAGVPEEHAHDASCELGTETLPMTAPGASRDLTEPAVVPTDGPAVHGIEALPVPSARSPDHPAPANSANRSGRLLLISLEVSRS